MNKTEHSVMTTSEIKREQRALLSALIEEEQRHGGYERWYNHCRVMRKEIMSKYISYYTPWNTYRWKVVKNYHGHYIDHHILSYLAPLDFHGIGWGNYMLRPFEQIFNLDRYFKEHGVRFIYVPLPNKGVIYPEVLELPTRMKSGVNSPQWRKYVRDVVEAGVEVVDVLPNFVRRKNDKNSVYNTVQHYLSSYGAMVVADEISNYLQITGWDFKEQLRLYKKEKEQKYRYTNCPLGPLTTVEKLIICSQADPSGSEIPYVGEHISSSVGIFGDCNVEEHNESGGV